MTTRTLVILRHAKAATVEGVLDFDRPLTPRGHADAAAAGAWLEQRDYRPDLVLCSSARRTRETWHGVALALSAEPEVRYVEEIYSASTDELLELVTDISDEFETALLIGHNPGFSQLSAMLDPDTVDGDGLRTAAAAVHAWDGSWVDCGPGAALAATHTARA